MDTNSFYVIIAIYNQFDTLLQKDSWTLIIIALISIFYYFKTELKNVFLNSNKITVDIYNKDDIHGTVNRVYYLLSQFIVDLHSDKAQSYDCNDFRRGDNDHMLMDCTMSRNQCININHNGNIIKIEPLEQINDKRTLKIYKVSAKSIDIIRKLIVDVNYHHTKTLCKSDNYLMRTWNDPRSSWVSKSINVKKNWQNVFLSEHIENDLKKQLDTFMHPNTSDEYAAKGIPYKKSFMFHGKPGCGKSSTVFVIAAITNMEIYNVKFDSFKDPKYMLSSIPDKSIILIDDVDCCSEFNQRQNKEPSLRTGKFPIDMSDQLTSLYEPMKSYDKLGTMLEFLDGYTGCKGSIIIMTSNHFDKLDSAFTRAGRIDHCYEYKVPTYDIIQRMIKLYTGCDISYKKAKSIEDKGFTTSLLINTLILPNVNMDIGDLVHKIVNYSSNEA